MQMVMSTLEMLRRVGKKLGPYLMLELLLPGGTLVALLFFLYQREQLNIGSLALRTALAMTRALVGVLDRGTFVLQPCYARPTHAFRPRVRDEVGRCGAARGQ